MNAVFAIGSGWVKVVDFISYCGGTINNSIIGCAPLGGSTMVIERGRSGVLFAHEYGHNKGLYHRDSCNHNLMSSSGSSLDTSVNTSECLAFVGGQTVTLDINIVGTANGLVLLPSLNQICAQAHCSYELAYGTTVTIITDPNPGYISACTNPNPSPGCTITMVDSLSFPVSFVTVNQLVSIISSTMNTQTFADVIFESSFEYNNWTKTIAKNNKQL